MRSRVLDRSNRRSRRRHGVRAACRVLVAALYPLAASASDPVSFFWQQVQPLLAGHCHACHTESRMGGLRLDSREAILKGGKSGPALVPGRPDESLLIQAVSHTHAKLKMPPPGKLAAEEIASLRRWIEDGAHWTAAPSAGAASRASAGEHWAFQPVRKPVAPPVRNNSWPKTPLDRFILARLESRGLLPVGPATRRVLLRRATFDLTGLPPTPAEVEEFVGDTSPDAWSRVVERLLGSPHYGERWGRHWLDVARYADDDQLGLSAEPFPNAFRYRDWVVRALNDDLPFDQFVKAQIAGDLLEPEGEARLKPGLGLFALGPWYYQIVEPRKARADERHDRVDVLTRGFLGLTVACARCHDHKYDPISMRDYYALAGIFSSTEAREHPLATRSDVEAYAAVDKQVTEQKEAIEQFIKEERNRLGERLARQIARHLSAARASGSPDVDAEVAERWKRYLDVAEQAHPFLDAWKQDGTVQSAEGFQALVLSVLREKRTIDEYNQGVIERNKQSKDPYDIYCKGCNAETRALERDRFVLWTDLFSAKQRSREKEPGVLYFSDDKIDRWLEPDARARLQTLRDELERRKQALPKKYPFLHVIAESAEPTDLQLHVRGDPDNLGDAVPRRFLSVLGGQEAGFRAGSGRLALAEAIASSANPLTARVIVNRLWKHHFGAGLVRTPSNFGAVGEPPSHPELLDYLAARLVEQGWSLKAIHREILLSAVYQSGNDDVAANLAADPENRLLWRANRRRLDAESLRDALLRVTGDLDPACGGESFEWDKPSRRRTLYGRVSRFRLERYLTLFDFPDPTITSEQRAATNVPLQRLFFLNSDLIAEQSGRLAEHLQEQGDDRDRIRKAYRLVFARPPTDGEIAAGLEFVRSAGGEQRAWARYVQVLFGTNEFSFVD